MLSKIGKQRLILKLILINLCAWSIALFFWLLNQSPKEKTETNSNTIDPVSDTVEYLFYQPSEIEERIKQRDYFEQIINYENN